MVSLCTFSFLNSACHFKRLATGTTVRSSWISIYFRQHLSQHPGLLAQVKFLSTRRKSLNFAIKDRSEQFWNTQKRFRKKSRLLLSELRQTRYKLKEKMEKIIERENIWTLPNILCIARIGVSPYLGYLILENDFNMAFYIMILAGITDLLDGLIARTWKRQSSKLGSFLDPLADKILISTMFITMTYSDLVPVFLTALIIARDVSLAAVGFYIRYKSLPPPKTLARYLDPTHATAQLSPTLISKVNTLIQLAAAGVSLTAPVFHFTDHPGLFYLWSLTAVTTVASALSYVYSKNTYRILKNVHRNT